MNIYRREDEKPEGHCPGCCMHCFTLCSQVNPESVVYGFLGGPHGVYSHEYRELTQETIDHYRNMGGFDMIRSGRHKIETDEQKQQSLEICEKLNLNGLVVIGGDDSNTNAAILAEYFKVTINLYTSSSLSVLYQSLHVKPICSLVKVYSYGYLAVCVCMYV